MKTGRARPSTSSELAEKSSRKSSTLDPCRSRADRRLEESFSSAPVTGAAVSMDPATRTETDEKYASAQDHPPHRRRAGAPVGQLDPGFSLAEQSGSHRRTGQSRRRLPARSRRLHRHPPPRWWGVERDENGAPVQPEPIAAPEAPSAMMNLLLERGSTAALLVFVLLGRSLRQPKKGAKTAGKEHRRRWRPLGPGRRRRDVIRPCRPAATSRTY
ncbi:MAG: hypothetical protein R3F17_01265 [Planctomycetota bacterium]